MFPILNTFVMKSLFSLLSSQLLVTCLSVLPCVAEVVTIACLSRPLLNLPWNWSFLLG